MSTQKFVIQVPEQMIERLRQKLALTDFPSVEIGSETSWERGPPIADIKRLIRVWQTAFDWRKAEAHLNTFPQFITTIEIDRMGAYSVHHIHKQSIRSDAIPLLFLHNWPGGFFEVTKMLEDLVQGVPEGPTFHVVAPSLIDFGFSSCGGDKFNLEHHAEAYDKLMHSLGYDRYVIQGGDIGHLITRYMAKRFGPSRCKAYHTTTPAPAQPSQEAHPELYEEMLSTTLSETEQRGLSRLAIFSKEGLGYYKQMSTKPTTIGFSLKDSPVGLLAWVYEKLHDWSDNYHWSDEEILSWVSIYYFSTPGPDAASSIYYTMEHADPPAFTAQEAYVDVPFGVSRFANDSVLLPKLWSRTLGPVVFENEHAAGGHFAAWERPDAMVGDIRRMFNKTLM
ncbi:Fc.00g072930.m01.CDS01 [Cosmosporella sp. VM-42]